MVRMYGMLVRYSGTVEVSVWAFFGHKIWPRKSKLWLNSIFWYPILNLADTQVRSAWTRMATQMTVIQNDCCRKWPLLYTKKPVIWYQNDSLFTNFEQASLWTYQDERSIQNIHNENDRYCGLKWLLRSQNNRYWWPKWSLWFPKMTKSPDLTVNEVSHGIGISF